MDHQDRSPFHRALADDPFSAGPTLMYADWLEEHGDSRRAEALRIHWALGQTIQEMMRHPRLAHRAVWLEKRFGKGWRRELPKLPGVGWLDIEGGQFRQARLRAPATFDREAANIRDAQPVWKFTFMNKLGPKPIAELARSPRLAGMRALSLASAGIDAEGMRRLGSTEALNDLTVLDLSGNPLGSAGLEALATATSFSRVERLDLRYVGNTPSDFIPWARVARPPGLRWLDLSACNLGDLGLQALARCDWLGDLEHLDLSSNGIGPAGIAHLAGSPHLNRLRTLDLTRNPLGDAGLQALARSPGLAGLEHVFLHTVDAGAAGLEALARWPGLDHVKTLGLGVDSTRSARFGDRGVSALARSPHLVNLAILVLNNTGLGDVAATALANGPALSRLVVLGLENNRIGDRGADAVAHSTRLESLKVLHLHGNPIGDVGIEALAGSPPMERLETLSLTLDDAGATRIATSRSLRRLDWFIARGSRLSAESRELLGRRFRGRIGMR